MSILSSVLTPLRLTSSVLLTALSHRHQFPAPFPLLVKTYVLNNFKYYFESRMFHRKTRQKCLKSQTNLLKFIKANLKIKILCFSFFRHVKNFLLKKYNQYEEKNFSQETSWPVFKPGPFLKSVNQKLSIVP